MGGGGVDDCVGCWMDVCGLLDGCAHLMGLWVVGWVVV